MYVWNTHSSYVDKLTKLNNKCYGVMGCYGMCYVTAT